MSKVFLHLLNVSITAGWIVLIVVLLRVALKKAPKWVRVMLWGLVALRLIVPVSIESVTSLVPSAETVKVELIAVEPPSQGMPQSAPIEGERIVLQSGFAMLNSAVNPTEAEAIRHVDTVAVLKTVAGWVWLIGMVGMLLYALISFFRIRRRVRASLMTEKGVYVCDEIRDPFILGVFRPHIFLPSGMDETTSGHVLAHEKAHLKRGDHIWKPLGFLLLSVYWFNPLLWLAYVLLCRDIELACDETVVKDLDAEQKAAYSETLLACSVSRRAVAACPLAFGETSVKSRIKSILNYKKPAFWIILVAVLATVAVAVCFLTVPKKDKPQTWDIVGTWEFYKLVSETYEEDVGINAMCGTSKDVMIFREDGTGTALEVYKDQSRETLFTYTVSENTVYIKQTGRVQKAVEYTYRTEDDLLQGPENTGEGDCWYALYVREGSIFYPEVQLTVEQITGLWITEGLAVTKGRPLTLSGTLTLNANGSASMHLNGDAETEMQIESTFTPDGSIIRFTPRGVAEPLKYYPWHDETHLYTLEQTDIRADDEGRLLASYDPQTDTIRFVVTSFGVLTFRRAPDVIQWLDFENDFSEIPWDSVQEWTAEAFPNVTFLWNSGAVGAKEDGKMRTLFSGMPITNVYLTDLTGDGKPELCATVYFGSGVVDSHIVVYDYVNKQTYALWNRMEYDYHLYMENGRLLVGKTPYHSGFPSGDIQIDIGTLVLRNGKLFAQWQSDGSQTPLMRFLHESDLYGEWIVEEERDGSDNVLYTRSIDLWKEYNFKEDGTVVYNETNPVSSVYEQAFGHPVSYPYTVRDNFVYIDEDNADGFSRYGYPIDRNTLEIVYQTSPGKLVYVKLRRMESGTD